MNLLDYIMSFVQVIKALQVQNKYKDTFLQPYLARLEKEHEGTFSPEQKFKIQKYYGVFIPAILCNSYKNLYGENLTDSERKRATLFGILTPIGDDLFDVDKLPIDKITALTFKPEAYNATLFSEKVTKEIQGILLNSVPHKSAYIAASKAVLDIQVETEKQLSATISQAEIEHITYTKGAVSVIIYHQCLDIVADQQMLDALFYIGSLYQLGNDLFDVYKDTRDQIYTLPNTCSDFTALRIKFIERVKEQNKKIMALPYPIKRKNRFSIIMNNVNARSLVAIDEWIALEKKCGGQIDFKNKTRKELIIDMEKPRLIIKWLYYTWQLPKL
ncbi:MAG: hypothetical protein RL064_1259 [Bacteroidota bacterium]